MIQLEKFTKKYLFVWLLRLLYHFACHITERTKCMPHRSLPNPVQITSSHFNRLIFLILMYNS